ncbi:MAG TPA: hypothetical protein VGH44_06740 [Candidatus Saccharimonadia bacterium]|jgi:hypothetical protein
MNDSPDPAEDRLRDLEKRAADLERRLWNLLPDPIDRLGDPKQRADLGNLRRPTPTSQSESGHVSNDSEPTEGQAFSYVDQLLIPEVQRALLAYEAGHMWVEMYNWQVDQRAVSVSITVDSDGVVVDSTMPWFTRHLSNWCTRQGYLLTPLNHPTGNTSMRPIRAHIARLER